MALTDKLKAIADAVRSKNGETSAYTLEQIATKISELGSGGSSEIPDGYVDASGATADASKILQGYTAAIKSGLVTGTCKVSTGTVTLSIAISNTTNAQTVQHGLGVVPKIIIVYAENGYALDSSNESQLVAVSFNPNEGSWPDVFSTSSGACVRYSSTGKKTNAAGNSMNYAADSITNTSFRIRTAAATQIWNAGATLRWIALALGEER